MPVLPETKLGQLEFFESHKDAWSDHAPAIGLQTSAVSSFKPLITSTRDAYNAMQIARDASKAATQAYYNAHSDMLGTGRAFIAAIKAFAETSRNANVYVLANIDPPAPPSPTPAPDVPTDLVGTISPSGGVTLTWNATRSGATRGIFFLVERQRASETAWTPLGGVMEKAFLDPSPMLGDGPVQYRVRAGRNEASSAWTVPISFNIPCGPGLTATSDSNTTGIAGTITPASSTPKAEAA